MKIDQHTHWMQHALNLAAQAAAIGEVPVGAIIVKDDAIVGEGYNLREREQCALEHAEIIAIRQASKKLGTWRLSGCTLYVTLEPCLMCAGAIYQARLDHVVYGAIDPKAGAMGSLYSVNTDTRLNHRLPVTTGVLADEASTALKDFFRRLRS